MIKFHQPKIKWTTQHINYTMKKQGATQPLAHASKWLGRKRKWSWNIYSMQSIPAQDFMVRILRSRTTMLRRWVMSPNNRNKFMIAALSLSLTTATLSFPFLSFLLLYLDFLSFLRFFLLRFSGVWERVSLTDLFSKPRSLFHTIIIWDPKNGYGPLRRILLTRTKTKILLSTCAYAICVKSFEINKEGNNLLWFVYYNYSCWQNQWIMCTITRIWIRSGTIHLLWTFHLIWTDHEARWHKTKKNKKSNYAC